MVIAVGCVLVSVQVIITTPFQRALITDCVCLVGVFFKPDVRMSQRLRFKPLSFVCPSIILSFFSLLNPLTLVSPFEPCLPSYKALLSRIKSCSVLSLPE